MARRKTREELERRAAEADDRWLAHAWLVRKLFKLGMAPTRGWHFVGSPRGLQAFLVWVAEDGGTTQYADDGTSTFLNETIDHVLYRIAESDGELESLWAARKERQTFFCCSTPGRPDWIL